MLEIEVVVADGGLGAVAVRDGLEAGRLFGRPREDANRGRHLWASLDDHGLAAGEEPELYRDLYAAAGEAWATEGLLTHYVVVPADEGVLAAWYGVCFAQEQVHAARALEPLRPRAPQGFTIRNGGPDDLETAVSLAHLIAAYQRGAPVWSGIEAPAEDEMRSGWAEFLAEADTAYFLAERDGEAVGHLALERKDDEAVELPVAATRTEIRGAGVGLALTEHALAWAYEEGFRTCVLDWRAANLLASRFWTKRGFRPTAYRLVRSVHP
jgi:ribosomal protein S18 acetylase RimI-like enzyme